MKRFLIVSLMAILLCQDSVACMWEPESYNCYMFSVFRRERMDESRTSKRFNQFWSDYLGEKVYYFSCSAVMEKAQQLGDREMIAYLQELEKYLDISSQLRETWTYPTKEDLALRRETLNTMTKKAAAYKGTRLKAQWMLLRMRANMILGENKFNVNYWNNTASKMPPSIYRDMMENIYAGALLRMGDKQGASDIYAKQGDMLSIKWALRKHCNLAGIKKVYERDPNAYSLHFLVQDFVNSAQEAMDSGQEDWTDDSGVRKVNNTEINGFISFANSVLNSGRSRNPVLWKAAVGELQYLVGRQSEAMKTLDEAVGMEGEPRMKDNARVIRLIASVKSAKIDRQYEQYLIQEIKWLCNKANEKDPEVDGTDAHYIEMVKRLVYSNLVPKYQKESNLHMALLLLGMMDESYKLYGEQENTNDGEWTPQYSLFYDYPENLYKLSGDQLKDYFAWLKKKPKGELERFAKQFITINDDYANDFIATRYIAEGHFNKAVPLLKKVSLAFMEQQNISYYLANRDYTKPFWTERQGGGFNDDHDGPGMGKLKDNPKLRFCLEIMDLEGKCGAARDGLRQQLAYELAKRYFQASYMGDCWYLTHYGKSTHDTQCENEMNFVQKAADCLKISKETSDFTLRQNSLYALAFLPCDSWYISEYDYVSNVLRIVPQPQSQQFRALEELSEFALQNASRIDSYVTRCDVLRQFRARK